MPGDVAAPPRKAQRRDAGWLVIATSLGAMTLVAGLVRYAQTVAHHVADDFTWLRHARSLPDAWLVGSPFGHYRPLFATWLWLLRQAGVDTPTGLTVAGVVLGVCGSAAVGAVVATRLGRGWGVFASGLALLVPIHHEAMLWTSAQADGLALLLVSVALLVAMRPVLGVRSLAALAFISAAAMFAKESAIVTPLLTLAIAGRKGSWRPTAASALGVVAALCCGWWIGGGSRTGSLLVRLDALSWVSMVSVPARLAWPGSLPAAWRSGVFEAVVASGSIACLLELGLAFFAAVRSSWSRRGMPDSAVPDAALPDAALPVATLPDAAPPHSGLPLARLGTVMVALGVPAWALVGHPRVLTVAGAGVAIVVSFTLAGSPKQWPRVLTAALVVAWLLAWTGLVRDWQSRNAIDGRVIGEVVMLDAATGDNERIVTFGGPTSHRGLPMTSISSQRDCSSAFAPTSSPCPVAVTRERTRVTAEVKPPCRFRYRFAAKPPRHHRWLSQDANGWVTGLSWAGPRSMNRCTGLNVLRWDGATLVPVL